MVDSLKRLSGKETLDNSKWEICRVWRALAITARGGQEYKVRSTWLTFDLLAWIIKLTNGRCFSADSLVLALSREGGSLAIFL